MSGHVCRSSDRNDMAFKCAFFAGGKGTEINQRDFNCMLVGGFNPFETYWSKWESSLSRGENTNSLKPPPSMDLFLVNVIIFHLSSKLPKCQLIGVMSEVARSSSG